MVSVLHLSDTHLGKRQYDSDLRRKDFIDAFKQALHFALDKQVDAVIHTGDLFDSRNPSLPDVMQCIEALNELKTAGIPFYGIVGNHDRKRDQQWLDLVKQAGVAERLTMSPTVVADEVALYGINAFTKPAWHAAEIALEEPPNDELTRILCMHQLVAPSVPEEMADLSGREILNRVGINIDGLALGGYHDPTSATVAGVPVWYAGSTERCTPDESIARSVTLLKIEQGEISRSRHQLDTREFTQITIEFDNQDEIETVQHALEAESTENCVVLVTLAGLHNEVTASDVHELVMNRGAAVCRVKETRERVINTLRKPSSDLQSGRDLIEEKLAERELSEVTRSIEGKLRPDSQPPTDIAQFAEEMVTEALETSIAKPDDLKQEESS